MKALVPMEVIEGKILSLRGHKLMLDRDLAELYGVETRILNQAVRILQSVLFSSGTVSNQENPLQPARFPLVIQNARTKRTVRAAISK